MMKTGATPATGRFFENSGSLASSSFERPFKIGRIGDISHRPTLKRVLSRSDDGGGDSFTLAMADVAHVSAGGQLIQKPLRNGGVRFEWRLQEDVGMLATPGVLGIENITAVQRFLQCGEDPVIGRLAGPEQCHRRPIDEASRGAPAALEG